jgi:hypothetical protein
MIIPLIEPAVPSAAASNSNGAVSDQSAVISSFFITPSTADIIFVSVVALVAEIAFTAACAAVLASSSVCAGISKATTWSSSMVITAPKPNAAVIRRIAVMLAVTSAPESTGPIVNSTLNLPAVTRALWIVPPKFTSPPAAVIPSTRKLAVAVVVPDITT